MADVDLVVLTRDNGPLHPEVERGLRNQRGVRVQVHRIIGAPRPGDACRQATIARARNKAKRCGAAPWLMFVDDDVVLKSDCVARLVKQLSRRPVFAALAADYLGQRRGGEIASHVSMGATLFRREVLEQIRFTWDRRRCECQCCCDDLRRLHWAIGYSAAAKARHLPKREMKVAASPSAKAASPVEIADLDRCARPETRSLPSACLVICYFGPPPGWINHYLISCAYNPSINFLIFTDQDEFPATPPNVRVERLSRASFNELATNKLGFEINVSRPYKLCDFKPTYGHLFEEYLDGWDYWGYADVDVVYGDVRRFLSLARFEQYDVFTARKEFIAGHFTLFRNNRRMRTLYQRSADYRTTLQNPEMLSFSECGKQWGRRMRGEPLTDDATCDSMMHVITRQVAAGKLSACYTPAAFEWPDMNPNATWRIRWHLGRLWSIDRDREAMYFHFNSFRRRPGYLRPPSFDFETAFDMAAKGFEPARLPRKPTRKPLAKKLQEWF